MRHLRYLIALPLALFFSSAFADCSDKHARKDTQSPPPVTDSKQL